MLFDSLLQSCNENNIDVPEEKVKILGEMQKFFQAQLGSKGGDDDGEDIFGEEKADQGA